VFIKTPFSSIHPNPVGIITGITVFYLIVGTAPSCHGYVLQNVTIIPVITHNTGIKGPAPGFYRIVK